MSQPEVDGQRQRWLVVLSEFDMTEIAHIAGEKNVVADGLSRYPDPNGPSSVAEQRLSRILVAGTHG